ncbi:MAG: ABC transporter ATP-binding protein [Ilumatobacteraceae bacterium]
MPTELNFSNIRKSFGPVVALDSFSLDIKEGELVTLLGPSGCGKTTALRVAAGFEQADAGTVTLGGIDITSRPPNKRNMGMVFQNYSLFPHLSVRENIGFGLKIRKHSADKRQTMVDDAITRVRLAGLADRFPHQLSGGQQQRVALARALAITPDVLLLDEPLSALDAKVRGELRDEIRRVQRETGVATLFVTHDQDEALAISDKICVMRDGTIEQVGAPRDVYLAPSTPYVARFVGAMNEFSGTAASDGSLTLDGGAGTLTGNHFGAAGEKLALLVRPDDVVVCPANETGSVRATVNTVLFGGSTTVVRVALSSEQIVSALVMSRDVNVQVGEVVGLRVDTTRGVVAK